MTTPDPAVTAAGLRTLGADVVDGGVQGRLERHGVPSEIRVAESENNLVSGQNLLWDSQVVNSGQSFDVPYGGPALSSRTRYYWQVRVWDNYGNASAWSAPAWFETTFLNPSQFQGDWIGDPDPLSLTGSNWIW